MVIKYEYILKIKRLLIPLDTKNWIANIGIDAYTFRSYLIKCKKWGAISNELRELFGK